MRARIYQIPKNAMQSGLKKSEEWILDYGPGGSLLAGCKAGEKILANLPQDQIRLKFATQKEAEAYAIRQNIPFDVELPPQKEIKPKVYADNFSAKRYCNWTH